MIPRRISFYLSLLPFLTLYYQETNCSIFQDTQLIATVCECDDINTLVTFIPVVNSNHEAISISEKCEDEFYVSPIIASVLIRVQVAGTLDFEYQNSYVCTVTAVASDGTESTVQLDILVSDCNDNPPVFKSSILSANISETANLGDEVLTLRASDVDAGNNGEILFSINDASGKFEIGLITGIITLIDSLDYETQDEYDFTVTVTDKGDPLAPECPSLPLSTTDDITIKVSDSADTPPIFTDNCCQFSVAECDPVNTPIGTFSAYDGDLEVDDDIEFTFLSTTPSCFALAANGLLTVSADSCLDREISNTYTLMIEATEVNQPRQSVRADFDIQIIDCNDIAPIFEFLPSSYAVHEGLAAYSTLISIRTSDGDQVNTNNSRTFVSILPDGNTDSIFAINEYSTALLCTQLLDRESYPNGFNITLEVSDYGTPPLSSTQDVFISLIDINDNPPTFAPTSYSETVSENLPADLFVLQLNATDIDIGVNADITYNVISGNDALYFSLNSLTGKILTTSTKIDREEYSSIHLTVSATDAGANPLITTADVIILISDENDNTPVFSTLFYNYSVAEEQDPASVSLLVNATDLDDVISGNGAVNYSIVSGDEGIFFLNNSNLWTTLRFDRETRDLYQLIIEARDNGTPSLSSTASVMITITDTNDNAPIFTRDLYIVGFSENSVYETEIIQFQVTDADIPPYSLILFELVTLIQGFAFNSETGQLVTDNLFVGRAGEHFEFTITAYDNLKTGVFNSVSQSVKVIVIEETHRLIALVDIPVETVRGMGPTFRDLLENITLGYVNIEDFVPVTVDDQIDSTQTQVVFHVIDLDTEWVADPESVLKDVDERFEDIIDLFEFYSILSISPYPTVVTSPYILTALIVTVSVLLFFLCLTCCCCFTLFFYIKHYRKHVKKKFGLNLDEAGNLLTRQHAKSFSSLSAAGASGIFGQSNVAIMENPLWIQPYESSMGSLYSTDSTLYETKELIIDLFSEDLDDYSLYSVPSRVNTSLLQGPFELSSTDSTSSICPDDVDYLPNYESEASNFDFPSTSSNDKMALDAISEDSGDVISII